MIRYIYPLHKRLSIWVLIPVIAWCFSGLTHPMMAHWFKISPAKFFAPKQALPTDSTTLALNEILTQNSIGGFRQFRLIEMNQNYFYQIKLPNQQLDYYNSKTGKKLENGDELYAEYLARYYWDDQTSPVKDVKLLHDFTSEYKRINRLLPVYKVSFDNDDQLDVYVETGSSRYATANDKYRKWMNWTFSQFHNWSFLDFSPTLKLSLLILFSILAFIVALTGMLIYTLLWKAYRQTKIQSSNTKIRIKKWHRTLGILVSVAMLGFAFSGAFHAIKKFKPDQRNLHYVDLVFPSQLIQSNPLDLAKKSPLPKQNVSFLKMENDYYYQYELAGKENKGKKLYINAKTAEILENGDVVYAKYLACQFSRFQIQNIKETKLITNFKTEREYGFIQKRLPVIKVLFDDAAGTRQYIETGTGKLSAEMVNADKLEALSFLLLHKYHSLDFMGKTWRDLIMSLACLGILVLSLFGAVLWVKRARL